MLYLFFSTTALLVGAGTDLDLEVFMHLFKSSYIFINIS